MSTDLKTRRRFTSTIDKLLQKNLQSLSKELRVPQTRLLDEALEDLILKYKMRGFNVITTLSDEEENKSHE